MHTAQRRGVAVIGAGYWGPNLVRNFSASERWQLRWVCDIDETRARAATGRYSTIGVTTALETVLNDPTVHAVAVATPAATHAEVALAALAAGKHVLVEKPLADSVAQGERLVAAAAAAGRVLMCDHTYCYTPSARKIRELVAEGALGDIRYVDSVRINLGLVQRDVDVVWDLAPHDLSILDFILPEHARPQAVSAVGADPVGAGHACVAYLAMPMAGGAIAHAHVNWLSPTKIRTTIVAGSRRMLVWDDLSPTQRLSMYDRGVELTAAADPGERRRTQVSYRLGEMVAPALVEAEALRGVVEEFAASIQEHRPPLTDGSSGVRVLRILEAASTSLKDSGALTSLDGSSRR